ncbi:hypothetical protein HDC90_004323 [Pedobacter sp. AK013]|uniref:hypothetical protein n=1 Tax=Pedobacter sp. AK013 TaxID=2723071 RepID=UPI0016162310|nr:hypothetical protein [Pedobacter sp. AK013]MBB6239665.1 hypothetical protein [Pedobacter sp. AK013]
MSLEKLNARILERFRETKSRPNGILPERWLTQVLLPSLNPKEQTLINDSIKDLVGKDYIVEENKAIGYCLVLTENGYKHIYPINEVQTKQKIKDAINTQFRSQNSKPNHVIQDRWINQVLMQSLNPREQEYLGIAIDEMIEDKSITCENRSGMNCLVLSQAGFDSLY